MFNQEDRIENMSALGDRGSTDTIRELKEERMNLEEENRKMGARDSVIKNVPSITLKEDPNHLEAQAIKAELLGDIERYLKTSIFFLI